MAPNAAPPLDQLVEDPTVELTGGAHADAGGATRVVLVDARAERRSVMRVVLDNSSTGAVVVAEADGEADAVDLVGRHDADLAVIDFHAPVDDGVRTVGALRRRFPELSIVVASFDRAAATRARAVDEGADAYLLKPVSAREVMASLRHDPRRSRAAHPSAG